MDLASIVVILVLVFGVPLGTAWLQSRWEISRERRRTLGTTPENETRVPGQATAERSNQE
jgi:hypothetical protein